MSILFPGLWDTINFTSRAWDTINFTSRDEENCFQYFCLLYFCLLYFCLLLLGYLQDWDNIYQRTLYLKLIANLAELVLLCPFFQHYFLL